MAATLTPPSCQPAAQLTFGASGAELQLVVAGYVLAYAMLAPIEGAATLVTAVSTLFMKRAVNRTAAAHPRCRGFVSECSRAMQAKHGVDRERLQEGVGRGVPRPLHPG